MAVSIITTAKLAAALKVGDSARETAEVARLRSYCCAEVERVAPDAPNTAKCEAVIRWAGYLYDRPTAARGASHANALANSGALAILSPYRVHRAGEV